MEKSTLFGFLILAFSTFVQAQTILLQESFSTTSGTTPPTGWTVQIVKGDPVVDVWHFDNPGRREPGSPIVSPFAIFDSDRYSNNGQAEEVYLISPGFNATTSDKIVLEFDQYFKSGYGGACGVELYNGTSWVSIYTNSTTTDNPQHSTFDVTSAIQNKTNAKLRFKWTGNYSYYWIIDNIKILTQPIVPDQFTELSGITLTGVENSSAAWGDYDNDGDLDILLTGDSSHGSYKLVSKIYRNNADNTFTEQTSIALTGVQAGSVAWGDSDNDGDLDILLTGQSGNISYGDATLISKIYLNNGDNTFNEQTGIKLTGVWYGSANWGDYDGDGDMDILLTGSSSLSGYSEVTKIYSNNNDNSFTEQTGISLTGVRGCSAWGDYDSDGDQDILLMGLASYNSQYVSKIYRNDDKNIFSEQTNTSLIKGYGSVAWGDYDNDRDLDILITGSNNSGFFSKIYRNNGDNYFTEQTTISLLGVSGGSAVWGDYDNDGVLDILLTGYSTSSGAISKIFRNNGDNSFTEQTGISLPGVIYSSAVWGDYDNDSDLDILLTGFSTGLVVTKIYKNNNSVKNTQPSVPSGVSARLDNKQLIITWEKSTDKETPQPGLTYNLRVGTNPGGCEIMSPMALANGKRLIPGFGNVWQNTSWTIDMSDFSPMPDHLYYSVQAIDNGFMGSEWSPEKSELSNLLADFLPYSACQKTEVQFQDKSYSATYPITTYSWKFMEGASLTTSTEQNPKYTFQTSGSHQVELTVTNSAGASTTFVKTVTVLPSPLSNFTANDVCQGVPVVLDNTTDANTTNINGWSWNFGDNTSNSTLEEPGNHGYLNVGDYQIILTASATNGCSNSVMKTVSVAGYPIAEITADRPVKFCSGDSTTLSVSYNSNYIYKWLMDGTYLTDADSSKYVARLSGNFSVEVINKKANCKTKSAQISVTVQNAPAAPAIISSGPTTFCKGDSTTLSITGITGYSYQWKLNGGAVGSNSNRLVVKNAGSYQVVVTNTNGCKVTSSDSVNIVLNNLPDLSAVSLNGPTQLCEGDNLIMSIPATSGYTYQWRNENGPITGGTSSKFTATATGRYYLDIINDKGCKITTPPINVNFKENPPVPVVNAENYNPEKCIIEVPIVLRVKEPVETYTYQWMRNGVPINNADQSYLEGFLTQGDYTVEVNNGGCKSESLISSIYFENAPKKPLLYVKGPNVWYLACSNDSASQYVWYYNNKLITGADKYYYVANRNMGEYYVSISNATGCFTASDIVTIPAGITGIEDADMFETLNIYPNPTNGMFTIEMDNDLFGELLVSIITEQGKDILSLEFEKKTEHFSGQINLGDRAKGAYFINLMIEKYSATRKLIVE